AYVSHRKIGVTLISRMTVRLDTYNGRLPDLLFVHQDHLEIMHQKAVYGAPDLIIEIVSPNDRPSNRIEQEVVYCSLGVPEIVFIDLKQRYIRLLRKCRAGYEARDFKAGTLALGTVEGFVLQVDWLFNEPRPDEFDLLSALLKS